MKQSIPLKLKARDIVIGFFGWMIFSNLIFLLLIFSNNDDFFSLLMWLLTITTILALFFKKRTWVGNGIVTYVVINVAIWAIMLAGESVSDILTAASYPLPGIFLLGQ